MKNYPYLDMSIGGSTKVVFEGPLDCRTTVLGYREYYLFEELKPIT